MATKLDAFPERPVRRHELERYLDGSPWELTRGEDFRGRIASCVSTARELAKARGGRLRTRKIDDGTIVIQFVP